MISFTLVFFAFLYVMFRLGLYQSYHSGQAKQRFDPLMAITNFMLAIMLGLAAQFLVTTAFMPQKLVASEAQVIHNLAMSEPASECSFILGIGTCRQRQYFTYETFTDHQTFTPKRVRLYADTPVTIIKDQLADQYSMVYYYETYRYDWTRWFGLHNYRSGPRSYEFHVPNNYKP